jgi:hypothetical protein
MNPLTWLGILIAVLFALSARKMGFYHAWTMFFNVVIAVYLAVRIGPSLEEFFPASLNGKYATILALLAAGTGAFLIMQAIAYILMVGQLEVSFPRTVNTLGSALLGFLSGFLVWSFATFAFYTTPLSQKQSVKEIGISIKTFEEAKTRSYLVWWCSFLDKFIGSADNPVSAEQTIRDMLIINPVNKTIAEVNTSGASIRPADSNEPNKPYYPSQPPADSTRQSHTEIPP